MLCMQPPAANSHRDTIFTVREGHAISSCLQKARPQLRPVRVSELRVKLLASRFKVPRVTDFF